MGRAVTNAYLLETGADIAFENGGGELTGQESPLGEDRSYLVAMNSFLATDTADYPELAGKENVSEYSACEDALAHYLSRDNTANVSEDLKTVCLKPYEAETPEEPDKKPDDPQNPVAPPKDPDNNNDLAAPSGDGGHTGTGPQGDGNGTSGGKNANGGNEQPQAARTGDTNAPLLPLAGTVFSGVLLTAVYVVRSRRQKHNS